MNNTSAIILAAGEGTRLRPVTYYMPKALVKVRGKSVIDYVIDNLHKWEITNIYVNLHHKPIQIMKHLRNCAFFYEPRLLGSAGTIKALLLYQSRDFVVANADTITTLDIAKMMEWHKRSGRMATVAWANGKCTGTMIFSTSINKFLPTKGMIDDVLRTIPVNKYDSVENNYWDIGTFKGLFKARGEVK